MTIEEHTLRHISKEFSVSDQAVVIELLSTYSGPEAGRVVWDILQLSKGSLESIRYYLKVAQADYRDILYWAEYYDTDPLVSGHDPKQMVDDIIAKWGDKK